MSVKKNNTNAFASLLFLAVSTIGTAQAATNADCLQALKAGEYNAAMTIADALLQEKQENAPQAYLCKGRAELASNKAMDAEKSFSAAMQLAQEPVDKLLAMALRAKALKTSNRLGDSLTQYQQGLQAARSDKNSQFERIFLMGMAGVETDQKSYSSAIEHYQQALKLAANDGERAETREKLAAAYFSNNNFDAAVEHQLQAVLGLENNGDGEHYVAAELELARYRAAAKDYTTATKSIEKILKLSKEQNSAYWQAMSLTYLADVQLAQQDKPAAKTTLQQADAIGGTIKDPELSERITRLHQQLD